MNDKQQSITQTILDLKAQWTNVLTNNLDLPKFLELYQIKLQELSKKINNEKLNQEEKEAIELLQEFEKSLLELNLFPVPPAEVKELAQKRQDFKDQKDWQKADEIRSEIQKLGWQIDDYSWGFGIWWRGN
jgi:cysteinyl-tRNA synthetase